MYVLQKGLVVNSFLAFELLQQLGRLDECEETEAFVKRGSKIFNKMADWENQDRRYVRMIAYYCLEKGMYKLVWKWLTLWNYKVRTGSVALLPRNELTQSRLSKLHENFKQPYADYLYEKEVKKNTRSTSAIVLK
jgi:hypothetical protein